LGAYYFKGIWVANTEKGISKFQDQLKEIYNRSKGRCGRLGLKIMGNSQEGDLS
jgi:hypothetical protein